MGYSVLPNKWAAVIKHQKSEAKRLGKNDHVTKTTDDIKNIYMKKDRMRRKKVKSLFHEL